ncbi:hypothetical protein AWB73_00083 [Caballeronia turbans]|nr:hypothetical protein AWB73_00083 [Caballeronia turbans]
MTDEQIIQIARTACRPFPWGAGATREIFLDAVRAILAAPLAQSAEQDRIDAERYRWLRKQNWNEADMAVVCRPKEAIKLGYDCPNGERLDDAIDEAVCGKSLSKK